MALSPLVLMRATLAVTRPPRDSPPTGGNGILGAESNVDGTCMLKTLAIVLLALLALLQYRLWLGQGGVMEMNEVSGRVAALEAANQPLRDRNARLSAEVVDLKTGLDAIEERARSDVGMVRTDEQFFWVPGVETDVAPSPQPEPGSGQGASSQ